MARARLLFANVGVEAATTFAASASATGYAVTNLKNHKRWLPWRSSTTTGNQTVTMTFSARTIKAVFLLNWLIHAGGSVKVEYKNGGGGYANFGGGTGIFTIPSPTITNVTGIYDTAGVTATDIRITFTNTAAVSAYVELGGLFVVDSNGYHQATVNLTDDLVFDPIDPSEERVAKGGQRYFNEREQFLNMQAVFEWITASQKDELLAIRAAVGKRTPVIFAADPDDMNKTVYGRFAPNFPLRHKNLDQWSVTVPFEEAM